MARFWLRDCHFVGVQRLGSLSHHVVFCGVKWAPDASGTVGIRRVAADGPHAGGAVGFARVQLAACGGVDWKRDKRYMPGRTLEYYKIFQRHRA
jgi:hypothetical protein